MLINLHEDAAGFRLTEKGVFYVEIKEDDNGTPQEIFKEVAGPILVEALARDERGNSWGRVLKFRDPDGKLKMCGSCRWKC